MSPKFRKGDRLRHRKVNEIVTIHMVDGRNEEYILRWFQLKNPQAHHSSYGWVEVEDAYDFDRNGVEYMVELL